MKTGLKSFVRAISPFTKAGKASEPSAPPEKADVDDFNWDLSRVDMVIMLSNFYNVYNPERVRSVHEILHQYEGDEILMLQQLCERYNLSETDMQSFLDNALLGRKEKFGNWTKKKSEGSVTSEPGTNKDNASVESAKERPRSGYAGFVWDLSSVDLPKALKHLYRKHNPQKTPNVASLSNKTENEKILLLQQLCKRHNLTQADMQSFLDGARIKDDTSSLHSNDGSAKARHGSKTRAQQRGADGGSAAASDDGNQSDTQSLRKSVAGSSVASALFSSLHKKTSRQSIAEQDDLEHRSVEESATSADNHSGSNRVITGAAPQRSSSMPFWPSPFTTSTAAASPPPPPPPPPAVFNASPAPSRPPPPGRSVSAPQQAQQPSSPGSVASSVTSSVTASSRYVDGIVEKANTRSSPSPAPSVASLSRSGSLRAAGGGYSSNVHEERRDLETSTAVSRNTAASRSNSRVGRSVAEVASTAGSSVGNTNRSAEGARAAELLDLQRELSEARLQVVGVRKENQALLKALQDSKQRQNDAESTVSELSHHQAHLEQVPELLAEISKLNGSLKQQEEREAALKRQYSQLKQQVQSMHEQVALIEQQRDDAQGDARDVLRLVDIMSASPAGIKSVLEAYLKQLGEATGSVPVKYGIGTDGRQIPISERIALALKIKREQQQLRQGEAKKAQTMSVDAAEDTEKTAGRSTPSKTRGSGSANGKALERQQDNYQKFKSSLSEQQKAKKLQKSQQVRNDEEGNNVSDGALSDLDDEAGEIDEAAATTTGDYLDYASPDAGRKSRSSSRAAEKKQRNVDGQGTQGEAQASLASDIATDWIECLDPRSKRKYYYSAALKKSTWTKPVGFSSSSSRAAAAGANSPAGGSSTPVLASMGVTMTSRYNSPNLSMHMTGRQPQLQQQQPSPSAYSSYSATSSGPGGSTQRMTAEELNSNTELSKSSAAANNPLALAHPFTNNNAASSLRSASPYSTNSHAGSATSTEFSQLFTSNTRSEPKNSAYNSRSSSPAVSLKASTARSASPSIRTAAAQSPSGRGTASSSEDWVTAVDPNSNRKYWYNRKTKVSTWRQPAELII